MRQTREFPLQKISADYVPPQNLATSCLSHGQWPHKLVFAKQDVKSSLKFKINFSVLQLVASNMNSLVSFRCISLGKCSKISCLPRNHLFSRPRSTNDCDKSSLLVMFLIVVVEDQGLAGLPESPWPFARVEDPLFSLFRIGDDLRRIPSDSLIRWSKFPKKRRPSRAKQIQRNVRHKLSSNIIKAWNDQSFNLECPSSDLGFWVFFYSDFKETATWFQRSPKLLVLPGSERIAPKGSVTNCIRNTWFIGL